MTGVVVLLSCTPETGAQPAPTAAGRATSATPAPVAGVPSALATAGADAPIPNAERRAPLRALGPCDDAPEQRRNEEVRGLLLPADSVVTSVTPAEPLTNVQGYVPMTPVQVRAFYQENDDVTVISVEDEVFEAEVLFEFDDRRVFFKTQAVCELGSVFVAVVSPTGQ